MRVHPLGKEAAIIGEATSDHTGLVLMKTRIGGTRVVDMLSRRTIAPDLLNPVARIKEAQGPQGWF
jgi:hydrogenase maturation factor